MPDLVFTTSVRKGLMGGVPCVDGTRIPAWQVYAYSVHNEGDEPSLEVLLGYYPSLAGKVTERPVGGTE